MMQIAGLATLLLLPLLLLIPFAMAARRLSDISHQNAQMAAAAQALVTPDQSALDASQSLASAIRKEIASVNTQLADTVEVLSGVQTAITRENQSLDAAGAQLMSRSEDVGRNLTLQRQALESLTGTFDDRMTALSTAIETQREALQTSATAAEAALSPAMETFSLTNESLKTTAGQTGEVVDGAAKQLGTAMEQLTELEAKLSTQIAQLDDGNIQAQTRLDALQTTVEKGHTLLAELKAATETRKSDLDTLYGELSSQVDAASTTALTAQGETARMVEGNLAQMRREFARMETDMQLLQTRLSTMGAKTDDMALDLEEKAAASRLQLRPLETDFPPVEPPPRHASDRERKMEASMLDLTPDVETATEPASTLDLSNQDVLSRPGGEGGFGRARKSEKPKDGWRWRDMLGGLDRPDDTAAEPLRAPEIPAAPLTLPKAPQAKDVDIVEALSAISLSPAAIIDDGTILDATQGRIDKGVAGLVSAVTKRIPDPVGHLRSCMTEDPVLRANVKSFADQFDDRIGRTSPTAPALRATFGSPSGRAYLLCAAALA